MSVDENRAFHQMTDAEHRAAGHIDRRSDPAFQDWARPAHHLESVVWIMALVIFFLACFVYGTMYR